MAGRILDDVQRKDEQLSERQETRLLHESEVNAVSAKLGDFILEQKEVKHGSPPEDDKLVIRLLVGSKDAGGLIGKAGSIIKTFREESGAWIDIADAVRGAPKRIVTLKGTPQSILRALHFISERLAERKRENKRNIGGQQNVDGDPAPFVMQGWTFTTDTEVKNSITFLVANAQVGCIIGKNGEQIRTTRMASGANVKVSEKTLEGSTEKTVYVEGTSEQVDKANTIIIGQLMETQDRAVARVPYVPRPPFPEPYGYNFDPYNAYSNMAPSHNHYAQPARAGHAPLSQFSSPPVPQVSSSPVPQFSVASSGPIGSLSMTPVDTIVLAIPDGMIGAIIGKGGSIINEIRRRSGAQVKIGDLSSDSVERLISVTGTRQANEAAVALIREKMSIAGGPAISPSLLPQHVPRAFDSMPSTFLGGTFSSLEQHQHPSTVSLRDYNAFSSTGQRGYEQLQEFSSYLA